MATFDLAYMHPGTVTTKFAESLTETAIAYPQTTFIPISGKALVRNKNFATKNWYHNSKNDWLLWVDQDMGWEPNDLAQLFATADEKGPSIVSALCYGWMDGNMYPSFFVDRDENNLLLAVTGQHLGFPDDEAFEVPGTGGGFMLIHREILGKMLQEPHIPGYAFFFAEEAADGRSQGYSQYLCKLAADLGYAIWIEPRCEAKHYEEIAITTEMYKRWWGKDNESS